MRCTGRTPTALAGLDAVLDRYHSRKSAQDTIHDWAATVALDQAIDRRRGVLLGGQKRDFTSRSLSGVINWDSSQTYDISWRTAERFGLCPAARRRRHYLTLSQLRSISFRGSPTLSPEPLEWTVDPTPPNEIADDTACGSVPDGTGAPALYSGCGRTSIVSGSQRRRPGSRRQPDVRDTVRHRGGLGLRLRPGLDRWRSDLDFLGHRGHHERDRPRSHPCGKANVPGFTGSSGTWRTETADLSAYAGQQILIGFRYITDPAVDEAGFWVRNIDVAGVSLPSGSLADGRPSPRCTRPRSLATPCN